MNFKELCEFTAEEVNGRPLTFSSMLLSSYDGTADADVFKRRVIRQVKKAYQDICLHSRHWRFLHKRGTLLNLRANVEEYSLPNVESIDWDSLYLTQSGTTARWPIVQGNYNTWQALQRSQNDADSIPCELIRTPDPDKWIFYPAPSAVYVLNGDLQWKMTDLVNLTDTPCWDSEFHDLVAYLAIRRLEGRVRTQDEIVSQLNTSTAQQEFAAKWDTFCARYLPKMHGACALF